MKGALGAVLVVIFAVVVLLLRRTDRACGLYPHVTYIVYSERVVTPSGVTPAAIFVDRGAIVAVKPRFDLRKLPKRGGKVLNYGRAVISPGVIDAHVHLNEPGRTEWEGFETGTRAAAAGGVTTVIDMPINSKPAATYARALKAKMKAARGRIAVDVGFWGGLVPENAARPAALAALLDAGCLGLKAFMSPSGVSDFAPCNSSHLAAGLNALAVRPGSLTPPLIVHAELPSVDTGRPPRPARGDESSRDTNRRYAAYLASRPPAWERAAIAELVGLAGRPIYVPGRGEVMPRIHIAHLADAGSLRTIAAARAKGLVLSAEVAPHYLTFDAESIPDGGTLFKCAPPIREASHRAGLLRGLLNGTVSLVASDHSPCPPALKLTRRGDFTRAWGGISSLQLLLPATWTRVRDTNATLGHLARWLSAGPAALAGLTRKGKIAPGFDADLVVWHPERRFRVSGAALQHRHKGSPYVGRSLYGAVEATFVRGRLVFGDGLHALQACGGVLKRKSGRGRGAGRGAGGGA